MQDGDTPALPESLATILQTAHVSLNPPQNDELWSRWYTEADDTFRDFKSYEPAAPSALASGITIPGSGGSLRTLSARQISGQFDDEVAKTWEEDWEDEDAEDTLDYIMGQMSRIQASTAATKAAVM